MSSVNERIAAVEKELQLLAQETKENEVSRRKLLDVCRSSVGAVAKPSEQIWQMIMQPHLNGAMRSSAEMGLLDALTKAEKPVTAEELAKSTGGDRLLIARLLRPLCTVGIVVETDVETYLAGPVCKTLATPPMRDGWTFMHDEAQVTCGRIHKYLKENGYRNPEDASKGLWQWAHNSDLPLFPYLIQRPEELNSFFNMLFVWRQDRTEWFDIYPVEDLILKDFESTHQDIGDGGALLVDVGGATGFDIQNFKQRFESKGNKLPGKLVLQDLPFVIDDIKELDAEIVRMKYDFWTPQPVKGAKSYYMRSICHDYPDSKAHNLLTTVTAAMTPGYSRLLLNEWVLPDRGAALIPSLMDINMMAFCTGVERSASQWKALIGGVDGLEIKKVWTVGEEVEGLIECIRTH